MVTRCARTCGGLHRVRRAQRAAPHLAPAFALLRRRLPPRRDDLVRSLADEFRHVVEFEGEGTDAGGRRAYLDDKVADLRFRHFGAHHVPAAPVLARVEAEDLTAP